MRSRRVQCHGRQISLLFRSNWHEPAIFLEGRGVTGVGLGGSAIVLVLIYDKKKFKYIILKFKFNKWARILYLRSYFAFVLPKSICHLPGCGFGKCGLVYVVVSNECFSSGAGMLSSEHSEHDAKKLVSIKRYIFKVLPLGSYYVKQVWLFVLFLYSLCVFQGEEGREEGGGSILSTIPHSGTLVTWGVVGRGIYFLPL